MISVEVCNQQSALPVDAELLRRAVAMVLAGESITSATISIAVVDGTTMRKLNRRYLRHDYDTDVLSFVLDDGDILEGEVILGADTARQRAGEFDWSAADELLLYLIHGTLHLAGYDDKAPGDRGRMRGKEMHYLEQLGRDADRADPLGEARRTPSTAPRAGQQPDS